MGVTPAQVPPGSVDGCDVSYAPGRPTSTLLTPQVKGLFQAGKAKIGVSPLLPGVVLDYNGVLALKHAIVTANSLDGQKIAAALTQLKNMPGNIPGSTWTYSAADHTGFVAANLKECSLKAGQYDILTSVS
jgi:2-hydroxychromene-2-carboxylate isomerase